MSYSDGSRFMSEISDLRSHDLKGKNILIVDDNEINREIDIDLLSLTGAAVFSASDGLEAIAVIEEKGIGFFCFILMDINMPKMDGYEAAKAIRAKEHSYYSDIPIIAFTSNALAETKQAAFEAGMNDYMEKPVDLGRLGAVLDKVMKQRS